MLQCLLRSPYEKSRTFFLAISRISSLNAKSVFKTGIAICRLSFPIKETQMSTTCSKSGTANTDCEIIIYTDLTVSNTLYNISAWVSNFFWDDGQLFL